MSRSLTILLIVFCITGSSLAQKLLILERPGTTKHFIFRVGDDITLTESRNMRKIHGGISRINDTSFVVNYLEIVNPTKVVAVYRPLTMLHLFSRVATIAGLGYFILTGVNNAINSESPLIDDGTLIASAVVTGAGVISSLFRYRKFKIGDAWRLKILDMDVPR